MNPHRSETFSFITRVKHQSDPLTLRGKLCFGFRKRNWTLFHLMPKTEDNFRCAPWRCVCELFQFQRVCLHPEDSPSCSNTKLFEILDSDWSKLYNNRDSSWKARTLPETSWSCSLNQSVEKFPAHQKHLKFHPFLIKTPVGMKDLF